MGIGLADPEKLATVGRERGHQVLIKRNDSEYGLYIARSVRKGRTRRNWRQKAPPAAGLARFVKTIPETPPDKKCAG
jgi:hypothetical protein